MWDRNVAQTYDYFEESKLTTNNEQIKYGGGIWRITPDDDLQDDEMVTIYSAAQKLCQFIEKRDVNVVFHGPNECSEKKYWNKYHHFHLTYINQTRPGCDKIWMSVIAQHRELSNTAGNIPPSQQTRFLASWANYLSQKPRTVWVLSKSPLMDQFQTQMLSEYIPKPELPPRSERFREADEVTHGKREPVLHLTSGKHMSLFRYLKWQVTTYNYHTREEIMTGSVVAPNQDNFERALVHPMSESTLQKVFAMDRTLEIQHLFKHRLLQTNWLQFTENPMYLSVDESLQTFMVWCNLHNIVKASFIEDMWQIMAKTKPKQNLMFLKGVPN